MLPDKAVQKALERYVCVAWTYDGLNGSVLQWTKRHGNAHDDPSDLAWILAPDGREIAGPADGFWRDPATLAQRLDREADAWKPTIRIPMEVLEPVAGEDPEPLRLARAEGRPALLYFFRPDSKSCAEFEGFAFSKNPKIEKLSREFACFRMDVSASGGAEYAARLGSAAAPGVVLFPPGRDAKPIPLPGKPTSSKLTEAMETLLKATPPP